MKFNFEAVKERRSQWEVRVESSMANHGEVLQEEGWVARA